MEDNNNKSGGNFLSGFLFGALIGAAIVLLLVTKKGKKILKAISEESEGKISNILNKLEDSVDSEEEFLEESSSEEVPVKQEKSLAHAEQVIRRKVAEDKPRVRRFFKGVSRHVN